MTLFYIANGAYPSRSANSIHVMKMCQALNKEVDVTLIYPSQGKGQADLFDFYSIANPFNAVALPLLSWLKGRSYVYEFLAVLYVLFKRGDTVFTRRIWVSFFCVLFGIKVILESHAPYEKTVERTAFRWLSRRKKLVLFVVITEALKTHFIEALPSIQAKIYVSPDAADVLPENVPVKRFNRKDFSSHVGYVGHLYSGKGMELIKAVAELDESICYHIVGGLEEDVKRWKASCGKLHNIVFYGFVQQAKISSYLQSFDVLLLPLQPKVYAFGSTENGSSSDIGKWTSPLKAFEYMSAGKPIIASKLPVLKEVFTDGVNCFLCGYDEPQAWLEAIKMIEEDASKAYSLAVEAKRIFLEKYTWDIRAKNCLLAMEGLQNSGHAN